MFERWAIRNEGTHHIQRPRNCIELLRLLSHCHTVVEVGVFEGDFRETLLRVLRRRRVVLVDPGHNGSRVLMGHRNVEKAERRVREVTERFGQQPVEIVRMCSPAAARQFPDQSIDLVHLDGDHRYQSVLADLRAWAPKVRERGTLAGHDYCWFRHSGAIEAITRFTRESDFRLYAVSRKKFASFALRRNA